MNSDEIGWEPATSVREHVRSGSLSVTEIAAAMVERVRRINPTINALVHFDADQVLSDAAELDRRLQNGEDPGPLRGVPYTIKDLTAVKGVPLTFGLLPMRDTVPDRDAAIVTRMREAGGLFLGKTNTPECGYYGGTVNHLFGATENPWGLGLTPGGSSGGAGSAVAAGLGPLAEGSDGGGSIRVPAAMCGVVGFKPSTGVIPESMFPGRFNEWLYHGPITRTVTDAALMMDVLAGPDPSDPKSAPSAAGSWLDNIDSGIDGLRIAWSPDLGLGYVDPEVESICRTALDALVRCGAKVEEATPGWGQIEQSMWHGIWVKGFASAYDLLDWSAWKDDVDDNLLALLAEAGKITAVDVARADVVRGAMWDVFARFMNDYDLLVSPTLATAAYPHSQFAPSWLAGESLQRQLLGWVLTYPFNMTTTPAISVPAGFTADGRPVGLQIAGGHHADRTVLRSAAAFETEQPWMHLRPPLTA
jgi:aspartyl-tRNA(Asn)/glutamyl-tRNA(Gln) amidotransferase subunit A